jgi:hypothetical protein
MRILRNVKLGTRFTIILVGSFLISISLSGFALYSSVRTIAEESVTSNGLLLLHMMNAVRDYTSTQVNPLLVPDMDARNQFIPESVPAFSARSVFDKLRGDQQYKNFFYKEASTNPTAPQDRADEWETQVLNRFRNDAKLQSESGFRTLNGQIVFYNARPMSVTDPACLACHSTPAAAPPAMIQRYGPLNGFGWKVGTVIAAQMVYVPAAEIYQRSWRSWLSMMLIAVISFALAVLAINLVLRRDVVRPVAQMAALAGRISNDDIDEQAPENLAAVARRSDELGQMARVFQRMAAEVYAREQALRQQVHELRIEIDEAKKARQVAELVETESFQDLRSKARKLREQHHVGSQPQPESAAPQGTPESLHNPRDPEQSGKYGQGSQVPPPGPSAPRSSGGSGAGGPVPPDSPPGSHYPAAAADFDALQQQLARLEHVNGIPPLDIATLPEKVQSSVRKMLKAAMTPGELADDLGMTEDQARQIADILVTKGVLETEDRPGEGIVRYKAHAAPVRPRRIPPDL